MEEGPLTELLRDDTIFNGFYLIGLGAFSGSAPGVAPPLVLLAFLSSSF